MVVVAAGAAAWFYSDALAFRVGLLLDMVKRLSWADAIDTIIVVALLAIVGIVFLLV